MISPETLIAQIGRPDQPLVIDVRTDEDFADWPYLLPNSLRRPHHDVSGLKGPAITLCHKGLKLSLGAAALLQFEGQTAQRLSGGAVAWQKAKGIGVLSDALPDSKLWTMTEGPEAHLATWIVKRFLPSDCKILVVESSDISAVSDRFAAHTTSLSALLDLIEPLPLPLRHMIDTSDSYRSILSFAFSEQALAICDAHFAQSKEALR